MVQSNDIKGTCLNNDCSYTIDEENTPIIKSYTLDFTNAQIIATVSNIYTEEASDISATFGS